MHPSMLRENFEIDDEDPAFEDFFFVRYQTRPAEQDDLNAIQFCSKFHVVTRTSLHQLLSLSLSSCH